MTIPAICRTSVIAWWSCSDLVEPGQQTLSHHILSVALLGLHLARVPRLPSHQASSREEQPYRQPGLSHPCRGWLEGPGPPILCCWHNGATRALSLQSSF